MPKSVAHRWHCCIDGTHDHGHIRGETFGECHFCDDGYELIEDICRLEDEQCRCVTTDRGVDRSDCEWHGDRRDDA